MMNRNEAWNLLLEQANQVPDGLEVRVEQAIKQGEKRVRRRKRLRLTAAVILSTAAMLVLLVNSSLGFALAASRVPIVGALVEAVVFDPSLKAAVSHEYVQLVDQVYTKDGVTLELEYLIADPKNLSVFYRVYDERERKITLRPMLKDMDGKEVSSSTSYGQEQIEQETEEKNWMAQIKTLIFGKNTQTPIYYWKFHVDELPQQLQIEAEVYQYKGLTELPLDIEFELPIAIEPQFLKSVRIFEVNQTVSVLGQKLTIDSIDVYPTNTRISWHTEAENDSWLTYLPFYITDQVGTRIDGIVNGISATGNDKDMGMGEIWLESAWYDTVETLTLHLDDAAVLPKDTAPVILHEDGMLTGLPDYIRQISSEFPGHFDVLTEKGTYHSNTGPFRSFVDADGRSGAFSVRNSRILQDETRMHSGYPMPNGVTYPLELEVGFAPAQTLEEKIFISVKQSNQ